MPIRLDSHDKNSINELADCRSWHGSGVGKTQEMQSLQSLVARHPDRVEERRSKWLPRILSNSSLLLSNFFIVEY